MRFLLLSLGAMALGAIALVGMVGVGYGYWILLGYGRLACCVLAAGAWLVVQEERGKLSKTRTAHVNRTLEEGWPLFVVMIPTFLGGIIRNYFPSLTGLLTLPMIILLLGTLTWHIRRRRESRLRSKG
jgi:membrane protein DedA with SNARE-associated domain